MNLKRVFAGVAAAATMLGGLALGATTANAADGDQTITINNSQKAHEYTFYKFADLTPIENTNEVSVVTNPTETAGDLNTALKTIDGVTPWEQNPAATVASLNTEQLRNFAAALSTDDWTSSATKEGNGSNLSVTLPQGWYVVTDTDTSTSPDTQGVKAIVATTIPGLANGFTINATPEQGQMNIAQPGVFNAKNGNLVVTGKPTKTITSIQPTGSATSVSPTDEKNADVNAGDLVQYKVIGTIPATAANYSGFKYQLKDTPGTGIEIQSNTAQVTIDTTPVTTITNPNFVNGVLTIEMNDKATTADYAGKTVTLTYSAKITNAIGDSAPNSVVANSSFLQIDGTYSTPVDTDADTTTVYTNDFTLKKVGVGDDTEFLEGAQFTIQNSKKEYGKYSDGVWSWTTTKPKPAADVAAAADGVFSPSTEGAQFTIQNSKKEYGKYSDGVWSWTTTKPKPAADVAAAADGVFSPSTEDGYEFQNLAAGDYTIKEIKAPNNYSSTFLPEFTVTVNNDHKGNVSVTEKDGDNYGLVTVKKKSVITVKNVKNVTQLPLTGAAGITMLVVVALLLGGAGALIAVRSRSLKRQLNA